MVAVCFRNFVLAGEGRLLQFRLRLWETSNFVSSLDVGVRKLSFVCESLASRPLGPAVGYCG